MKPKGGSILSNALNSSTWNWGSQKYNDKSNGLYGSITTEIFFSPLPSAYCTIPQNTTRPLFGALLYGLSLKTAAYSAS